MAYRGLNRPAHEATMREFLMLTGEEPAVTPELEQEFIELMNMTPVLQRDNDVPHEFIQVRAWLMTFYNRWTPTMVEGNLLNRTH